MSDSAILWTVAHQAPLAVRFSRQEYWSGFLFPTTRDFSQPRDRTHISCLTLAGRCFTTSTTWEAPLHTLRKCNCITVNTDISSVLQITEEQKSNQIYIKFPWFLFSVEIFFQWDFLSFFLSFFFFFFFFLIIWQSSRIYKHWNSQVSGKKCWIT